MLHLDEIKKEFDPQLSGITAYRSMINKNLALIGVVVHLGAFDTT